MDRIQLFKVHKPPHTRYLQETLKSGFYAEGPRVAEFEKQISRFVDNPKTVALNSGTSAIFLALYLSGVGQGKGVISTPMTSPATNVSIVRLGGKILWADVDPNSGNIDPCSVERLLDRYKDRVAAVMAVDWGGLPCDYDSLRNAIRDRAFLIEDAAHALGASYGGRAIGSWADYTCFSFQAIKHITTGDGGLLTCGNDHSWQRARRLRWFGIDRAKSDRAFDEDLVEAGFKFHMNDIAASIGLAQLEDLSSILRRRREIARYYESELKAFRLQTVNYDCQSAYWLFTLQMDNRDDWIRLLDNNGIDASPVFCRNDTYSALVDAVMARDHLLHTRTFNDRVLCIPMGDWMTDAEVEHVVSTMKKGVS